MMSANPNVEKLVSAWWAIPNRLLEGWQTTVREGLSPPWIKAYGRSIDAMEDIAQMGLRMQADWCRITIAGVRSGNPETRALGHLTSQAQNMVDAWSDTSQHLTSTWFQMMRELQGSSWFGLSSGSPEGMTANMPAMRAMQDILRNSLKMQAAWTSLLAPGFFSEELSTGLEEAGREKVERKGPPRKTLESDQAA